MSYIPNAKRYDERRLNGADDRDWTAPDIAWTYGRTSVGVNVFETGRAVIRRAFDRGVTHFDLAKQLWAAVWICRGELRRDSAQRFWPTFEIELGDLYESRRDRWPDPMARAVRASTYLRLSTKA